MGKVLCMIQAADGPNVGAAIALYLGRDDKGYAFWEFLGGSEFIFDKFASKKGDWWYEDGPKRLNIYSSDGKTNTLEFSLSGVPDTALPPMCRREAVGTGSVFPNRGTVDYRIGGSGGCRPNVPMKPVKP